MTEMPPIAETLFLQDADKELSLHFGFPTIQSRMLKAEPERLILDYTRTMMGFLLFQPKPAHIAMIGLGGGSLAKYCRRSLPDTNFTVVELLPEVIALRHQFLIPDDGENFRVICADGAEFIRNTFESFDVLLVDGFDRNGQPSQLCSLAFYDSCCASLRKEGLLVVNLCADDSNYDLYAARIATAFSGKCLAVEADEGENRIVFASKSTAFPPSFANLVERLRTLEPHHPIELDRTVQKIFHTEQKRGNARKKHR